MKRKLYILKALNKLIFHCLPNYIYHTNSLDQAAFLMAVGGKLVQIRGRYPHNSFDLKITKLQEFHAKRIGLVPYDRYCDLRRSVKKQIRKRENLPENFVWGNTGFSFMDIAHT